MVVSCKIKTSNKKVRSFHVVQAERLELSHLAALDPKSSVSTNSTTPAKGVQIYTILVNHKEVPLYFYYF